MTAARHEPSIRTPSRQADGIRGRAAGKIDPDLPSLRP